LLDAGIASVGATVRVELVDYVALDDFVDIQVFDTFEKKNLIWRLNFFY
jgi:hypothetical protein